MMVSSIRKNVIFNFLGKIWTILVSIIFVPIYVKVLHEEAYGIVTFFAVMQSVLNILGVGLQRTLRREFSRSKDSKDDVNIYKYKIMRSAEFVYFIIFLIIFLMCFCGADYISNRWLNYETLDSWVVSKTITMMGLSIGLQLIANLYAGGIYGLDLQGLANVLQMGWMTLKNIGVIPVVYFSKGNVLAFFIWMVVADVIYSVVLRCVLIKKISDNSVLRWSFLDMSLLKKIWKYAAGLFVISIGTAISTQIDKIVMSKSLTVTECGAYNCAAQLGGFTAYIPTIIGTAIFSNLASLAFDKKTEQAEKLFLSMNRLCTLVVTSLSVFIAVFSYEIILVWTGSEIYADIMKKAAPFLIIGFMFNAFQQVPYDYLLAFGNTKINQRMLAITIPYSCTITVVMTKNFGVMGAALAWFILLLIVTVVYLLLFYKFCFNKSGLIWILKDYFAVVIIVLFIALLTKMIVNILEVGSYIKVIIAIIVGGITLSVLFLLFEREKVKDIYKRVRRRL